MLSEVFLDGSFDQELARQHTYRARLEASRSETDWDRVHRAAQGALETVNETAHRLRCPHGAPAPPTRPRLPQDDANHETVVVISSPRGGSHQAPQPTPFRHN